MTETMVPRDVPAKKPTKSEQTRDRMLRAAAKVVGKHGYAKASIARITSEAKLAAGGFYYYFKTREVLFDELLPALGKEMIHFISERLDPTSWGVEREVQGFRLYLEYLQQRPEFYRVFSEAYVYAPRAYRRHFKAAVDNYRDALLIQVRRGHLNVPEDDAELMAYFLIGIRNYVSQLYMESSHKIDSARIERAASLYRTLIVEGIFPTADAKSASTPSHRNSRAGSMLRAPRGS